LNTRPAGYESAALTS